GVRRQRPSRRRGWPRHQLRRPALSAAATRMTAARQDQTTGGKPMNQDLYIYYRVRAEDAQRFQPQAAALQRRIAQGYDIATALKRRPDTKDGLHTWMEVYLNVPQGFESTIE